MSLLSSDNYSTRKTFTVFIHVRMHYRLARVFSMTVHQAVLWRLVLLSFGSIQCINMFNLHSLYQARNSSLSIMQVAEKTCVTTATAPSSWSSSAISALAARKSETLDRVHHFLRKVPRRQTSYRFWPFGRKKAAGEMDESSFLASSGDSPFWIRTRRLKG